MTVKYNLDVSTSRPWTLIKLLFKWAGSVWKSVLLELIIWLILFAVITIVYRLALNPSQTSRFERFVHYCDDKLNYIPMNFMLGFFVTSVLNRWLRFFENIGYIDNISLMVAAYVRGTDEKTRMMRRNIVRYCVLSQALVFRDISMRVRKRFPTIDSLVNAGFMMEHEKVKFDEFLQFRYNRYWLPFQWSLALCQEARDQRKIDSDVLLEKVGEEIKRFRTNMAQLCNFDWVTLPIMYPQLIVLAVHTYFLVCVFSRQFVISEEAPNKTRLDIFFPIMTVFQFVFYMGWLKVAEAMLNPFGEDDDDFECNFLLDKNLAISLTVVDSGYNKLPPMEKDTFWNEEVKPLYTLQSIQDEQPQSGLTGSTAHVIIPERGVHDFDMLPLPEEDDETIPHNRSFSYIQQTLKRAISSKGHIKNESRASQSSGVLKNVRDRIARSISHSAPNNVTRMENRRFQSAANLEAMDKSSSHHHRRDRADSLNAAIDAIVSESNAYSNFIVINEGSPNPVKESDNPFSFPSEPRFHVGHYYTHSPQNMAPHKLEDLQEDDEEVAPSRKATTLEPEDQVLKRMMLKREIDSRMEESKESSGEDSNASFQNGSKDDLYKKRD